MKQVTIFFLFISIVVLYVSSLSSSSTQTELNNSKLSMGIINKIKDTLHGDKEHEVSVAREDRHGVHQTVHSVPKHHQGQHIMEDTTVTPIAPVAPVTHETRHHEHVHHEHVTPSAPVPQPVLIEGEKTAEVVEKAAILKKEHHHQEHTQVQEVIERDIIQPVIVPKIKEVNEREADVYTSEELVVPTIHQDDGKTKLTKDHTTELTDLTSQLSIQSGTDTTQHIEHAATEEILAPIIKETVHRHVIEQVQPVINVERNEYHVKKIVQPVHQTVHAEPIVQEVQLEVPVIKGGREEDHHHHHHTVRKEGIIARKSDSSLL